MRARMASIVFQYSSISDAPPFVRLTDVRILRSTISFLMTTPALLEIPLDRGAEHCEYGAEGELARASTRLAAQCPLPSQLHSGLGEYVPLILDDVERDLSPNLHAARETRGREIRQHHDLAKKGGMKSPARIRVGVSDAALKLEGVAGIAR